MYDTDDTAHEKTILTVVGKDTIGIIAKVCTYRVYNQVNIEDISQTIMQSYFAMTMIADTSRSSKSFGEMVRELEEFGDEIGVKILCHHEDIFTKMHRSRGLPIHKNTSIRPFLMES